MSYYDEEQDYPDQGSAYAAMPTGPVLTTFQQVTTKIPPSFNGITSWFAFEEAIDDWQDVTELDSEKQGPALKNRLDGEAAVYKPLLDRDQLRDPTQGVAYFKKTLRPHFVKGNQAVFLWRFFQLFRASRGSQELLRWIARFAVIRKRVGDAWMDLLEPVDENDLAFQGGYNARAVALAAQNQQPPDIPVALVEYNEAQRTAHAGRFPINDNLMALTFTCLADLSETQRERLTSTLTLRGMDVQRYTFEAVRGVFIELFCAPRSSLDNPNLRASGATARSFCVIDDGIMDQVHGYWAEDEESGEVGFLPEIEDVFWVHDDTNMVWLSRPFRGRSLRRGQAKGKGKGKGQKGFHRFRPFKGKGKGKGKGREDGAHSAHEALKGFGKSKGKGKGKAKKGKIGAPSDGPNPATTGKGKGFAVTEQQAEASTA